MIIDVSEPKCSEEMQIITPSAILREWRPDDLPSLVHHANNPHIARCMRDGFPSPYTEKDGIAFLNMNNPDNLFFAVTIEDQAIGGIGIHHLSDVYRRSAEIGYWLSEEYWGKGIITDAVRALLPCAFRMYDLIRIQAGIFEGNTTSMRVLEKCGFFREAVHTRMIAKGDRMCDEYLYVIFRESLPDTGEASKE